VLGCRGLAGRIPLHREAHNLDWSAYAVALGGGVVSWDSGHGAEGFERELEEPGRGTLLHASLESYDLRSHRRRRWELPSLILDVSIKGETRHRALVRGVFGVSSHTRYDVIWLATRTLAIYCGKICSAVSEPPELSTLYMAPL
jgi:hypothetical protein